MKVFNAATRYSSLEADEFDEGSAAEEADASVTQIAEVVASKGAGGNDFFKPKNQKNQNHKTMMEAKSDPEKASSSQSIGAKNYGRG